MNNKQLLPTREIINIAGISGKTLKQYANKGIINQPVFKSHGRGGASLYWPRDVLVQIAHVKALKATGLSINRIGRILKGDNKHVNG